MISNAASHGRAAGARAARRPWARLLLLAGLALALPGAKPAPAKAARHRDAVAVLSGGCYWGVESVFDHVRGVKSATSGYAWPASEQGGSQDKAEAVRLVYDPAQISYAQILDVFFTVVQDPTQLDRQGPDVGTEYRSVIFFQNDSQRTAAQDYVDSLSAAHVFPRPIVTRVDALKSFEPVGPDQQHFAEKNPSNPYIVANDVPKLAALRQRFPQLYRG